MKRKLILLTITFAQIFLATSSAQVIPSSLIKHVAAKSNLRGAYLIEVARGYLTIKKYNEALIYYYQALKYDPNNSDLLIEIARVEGWQKNHKKAIELLQRALLIDPERRIDILRALGWQYIENGEPQKALPLFNEYLEKYPQDENALKGMSHASDLLNAKILTQARALVDKKQYTAALKYYYQALNNSPKNSDLLIETARVEGMAKHFPLAIQLLQKVLIVAPSRRLDVLRPLGWQYAESNQPEKAIPLFKEYLKKYPDDENALKGIEFARGIILKQQLKKARDLTAKKKFSEALIFYYAALAQRPNDADLLIEIARVEDYLKHHTKAIELLQKILAVAPSRRVDVLRPLGWQFIKTNQRTKALPLFQEYLRSHPDDQDAEKGLLYAKGESKIENLHEARLLFEQKKYAQALVYYNQALKMDPDNADLLIETARVEALNKQPKKGIELLKRVLKVAPSRRTDVLRPLAWQYAESGDVKNAALLFKEYLKSHPNDEDALFGLRYISGSKGGNDLKEARALVERKAYKESLNYYYKVLKKEPNNADLLIEIARVEGFLKNNASAIRLLQQVLQVAPERRIDVLRPLGWQYADIKEYQKAIGLFSEYLKIHPKDDNALKGIAYAKEGIQADILKTARSYVDKKKYHEALLYYYQALKNKPQDPDLLIETARVEGFAKNYYQAISLLEKVCAVAPKRREDVLRPLGWLYSDIKQFAVAVDLFTEYLKLHPNDKDANRGWYSTSLDLARQLVEQKQYDDAIAIYHHLYAKKGEIDILIEMAKTYGSAEQHETAIQLYREVLCIAPQKTDDVIKPLAWQLLWNGNEPGESMCLFRQYLCRHPQDADAKLGIARAYEFANENRVALCKYRAIQACHPDNYDARYGEGRVLRNLNRFVTAEKVYKCILAEKPCDAAAREGLALTYSWGRKPRKAAVEFMSLLRDGHCTNDVYINLAQAQRWAGFSDWGLYSLSHIPPNIKGTDDLRQKLLRDEGHPITVDYFYSHDSDTLIINSYQATAGYKFKCSPTVLGVGARKVNLRETGERILGNEAWVYTTHRAGAIDSPFGTHFLNLQLGERAYEDWRTFAWRFIDRWDVNDYFRVNIEARNEAIENIPSIENEILFTSASGIFDVWPVARLFIRNGFTYGRFSDGNIRKRMINRIEWTLFFDPKVVIGLNDRYFTDSNPELVSGYYNPAEYYEGKWMILLEKEINQWRFYFLGEQGRFMERPGTSSDLNDYEAAIEKDMNRWGVIRFYFGWSRSSPAINAPTTDVAGYWRRYYGLSYYVGLY